MTTISLDSQKSNGGGALVTLKNSEHSTTVTLNADDVHRDVSLYLYDARCLYDG